MPKPTQRTKLVYLPTMLIAAIALSPNGLDRLFSSPLEIELSPCRINDGSPTATMDNIIFAFKETLFSLIFVWAFLKYIISSITKLISYDTAVAIPAPATPKLNLLTSNQSPNILSNPPVVSPIIA